MNERIRELADKAIEDMPGAWNIPDEFCEKFAELIVWECARVADIAYENKCVWIGKDIVKHFGVAL